MYAWVPEDVNLEADVSPATWVIQRLRPWGVEYPQPIACFVPDIYEGYARVLHPAREYAPARRWVRWSELAARRSVDVTSETRFVDASGFLPHTGPVDGIDEPYDGAMPEHLVEEVATFLAPWTSTPSRCWFGLWDGNGTWWKGASGVLTPRDAEVVMNTRDPEVVAEIEAEARRIDDERDRVLRATPTFGTPQRQYFLMSGPLSAARALTDAAGGASPNLWWPHDRSWFVSTEVDGFSTYVGGTALLIDALISSSTIEAVETSIDTPAPY
jgi:hypothetical protein